jgi:GNAT superfamily N-acetyltransferase
MRKFIDILEGIDFSHGHCDALAVETARRLDCGIESLHVEHMTDQGSRVDPDFVHAYAICDDTVMDHNGPRTREDVRVEYKPYLDLVRVGDEEVRFVVRKWDDADEFIEGTGCNPDSSIASDKAEEVAALYEAPLSSRDEGMGLRTLQNDDVVISGGMRSGSSPPGFTRILYVIYDREALVNGVHPSEADVGKVEVWENQAGIQGLVNIEVDKKARGKGIASKVVQALVDTHDKHFHISDIRPKARGFWEKLGTRFFRGDKELTPEEVARHKGSLNGVIPKDGCSDAIADYAKLNSGAA